MVKKNLKKIITIIYNILFVFSSTIVLQTIFSGQISAVKADGTCVGWIPEVCMKYGVGWGETFVLLPFFFALSLILYFLIFRKSKNLMNITAPFIFILAAVHIYALIVGTV